MLRFARIISLCTFAIANKLQRRQQTKQERSYEIQIGNSSIEGILRQQRPGFSEGRGENETTDG